MQLGLLTPSLQQVLVRVGCCPVSYSLHVAPGTVQRMCAASDSCDTFTFCRLKCVTEKLPACNRDFANVAHSHSDIEHYLDQITIAASGVRVTLTLWTKAALAQVRLVQWQVWQLG